MLGTSFKYCYNYTRLSGVTFGLTNTSIFAPINRTELYTSANMSIAMVNNVDREMIFTATEASVRFYITRGWAPGQTTPAEEAYLDYLNITEVPSQVNTISCTSINENMVMLANSGVNTADMTTVANILNLYYNRTYTAAEYQAILSHCIGLPASYELAAAGAEAASVEASYSRGFNGMLKDDETYGEGNAYDFGARIYDSRLGRWLALDELAIEYSFVSPYVFTINNPIVFIDPDGRKVKGFSINDKGEVVISKRASADAIKIYNAMSKTDKGADSFKKLITSETKIYLELTDENLGDKHGDTEGFGKKKDKDGKTIYRNASIVISTAKIGDRYDMAESDDEIINAVGTHETMHAVDPEQIEQDRILKKEIKGGAGFTWRSESKAMKAEYETWMQFRKKNNQSTKELKEKFETPSDTRDDVGDCWPGIENCEPYETKSPTTKK